MVRSEQVRTFFYSTESQESKSEVLSISDLSCSAFPELVIAELKLIFIYIYLIFTDEKYADDIALVKFKPFDHSRWGKKDKEDQRTKINPVCLPESSFPDEDQVGFVVGLGLRYQPTCRTNGGGPEIYKGCAAGKGKDTMVW